MRFHILAVPHAVSTREYSTCAFTQKVVRMCAMLTRRGHTVFHYGHEDSVVEAECVPAVRREELEKSYPGHNWREKGFPKFNVNDYVYKVFNVSVIEYIKMNKQPGDFLLCMFGAPHKAIADAHPDLICVEPGIGYGGGYFA